MSNTPNLSLPYILPGQAQKHVTHNEAITALDAITQLAVLDRTRTAPPETSAVEVAVIAPPWGPTELENGKTAATMMSTDSPGPSGPVSATPSPLVSSRGVAKSV